MREFFDRYGLVDVVTRASAGIGWAFAEELAERGFDLVLIAGQEARLRNFAAGFVQGHGVTAALDKLAPMG